MKGHVYRRGNTWSYLFDVEPDPLTGRRRRVNGSGFTTEREASKARRTAMADYEKGRVVRSSRRTVASAMPEWLDRIEHSIKSSMVQNWRNYAAYYVIPYIELGHDPRGTVTFASQDDAWKRNPPKRMDHVVSRQLNHSGRGPANRHPESPVRTPDRPQERERQQNHAHRQPQAQLLPPARGRRSTTIHAVDRGLAGLRAVLVLQVERGAFQCRLLSCG